MFTTFYVLNYILMCTWFALIFFVINKLVHWIWIEPKPKFDPIMNSPNWTHYIVLCKFVWGTPVRTLLPSFRGFGPTKLKFKILPDCITIDASFILRNFFLAILPFIRFCITIAALCLCSVTAYSFLVLSPRTTAWIDVAILTLTNSFEFLLDRIWTISTNVEQVKGNTWLKSGNSSLKFLKVTARSVPSKTALNP